MNNILKTVLIALVVSGLVVGGVEYFRDPVDVDAIALEAASKVDVPDAIKGEKGDRGPVGPQGPKGDKGDKGEIPVAGPTYTTVLNVTDSGDENVPVNFIAGKHKFTFVKIGSSNLVVSLYQGSTLVKLFDTVPGFSSGTTELTLASGSYNLLVETVGQWSATVLRQN